jgi:hypothetical protein
MVLIIASGLYHQNAFKKVNLIRLYYRNKETLCKSLCIACSNFLFTSSITQSIHKTLVIYNTLQFSLIVLYKCSIFSTAFN